MTSYYDDCIVYLLAKAYQAAHGTFKSKLERYAITPMQNLILEVLWEQEGVSIGDICKRVSVDYATLSSTLDRMAVAGWIEKKRNPQDKRSWLIYLTRKSRQLKGDLLAAQEETNRQMTADLSDAEKLLLFRMLKDLHRVKKDVSTT